MHCGARSDEEKVFVVLEEFVRFLVDRRVLDAFLLIPFDPDEEFVHARLFVIVCQVFDFYAETHILDPLMISVHRLRVALGTGGIGLCLGVGFALVRLRLGGLGPRRGLLDLAEGLVARPPRARAASSAFTAAS